MGGRLQEFVTVGRESAADRGVQWAWRPWRAVKRKGNRRLALGFLGLALLVAPQAANQARSRTSSWTDVAGTSELADRGYWNTVGVLGPSATAVFASASGDGYLIEQ